MSDEAPLEFDLDVLIRGLEARLEAADAAVARTRR